MIVAADVYVILSFKNTAYIAGTGDGIVIVNNVPASRHIYVLDAITLDAVQHVTSLKNGHYLFTNLDPSKQYLVMCRDLKPNGIDQRYEPMAWDYVTPATDLTILEQQALWQSWIDDINSSAG